MEFEDTRAWIGRVGALFIFSQITLILVVPGVNTNNLLIALEVAILGAMLGIDILNRTMQERLDTTYSILGIVLGKNDDDS